MKEGFALLPTWQIASKFDIDLWLQGRSSDPKPSLSSMYMHVKIIVLNKNTFHQ